MKILYIANIRLPTEKAHGVQIMKTCEAFAHLGHEVELVVPDRKTPITEDPFAYYGVEKNFSIVRVPTSDTVRFGRIGFLFETWSFTRGAMRYIKEHPAEVVYGRDEMVLYAAILRRVPGVVWESHTGAWNVFARRIVDRVRAIVVISEGLQHWYRAKGVSASKLIVAHDGVDLEAFAHPEPKESARVRLGLPQEEKIALYIGRVDGWKGVSTLCEASNLLSSHVQVVVIGGEEAQVATLRSAYPRVLFLGYHPYRELADNQAAADVLVLPNTSKSEMSARFTSPLKLFTYMASGVPIVASDLPSVREVVSDEMVFFVKPDDAAACAHGIEQALSDGAAASKAALARSAVVQYSWDERARRIISSIMPVAN